MTGGHACERGPELTALSRDQPLVCIDMPKQKRPFEVEIEAKLTVQAFDEESARKKAERALARGRNLAVDVDATGAVWTYAATHVRDPADGER